MSIKATYNKLIKYLKKINRIRHKIFRGSNLYFFIFLYFSVIMGIMFYFGWWISPDRFIFFGLILALIVANPFRFLKDWAPLVFLLLGYEFLRGLAPMLHTKVNIYPLINADKFMFGGHIPTIELQKWLYIPGQLHFYDFIFTILYMMHFALPLIFGFYLWTKKRERFRHFMVALLVLSYLGFITYLLYPAMPPWMAAEKGIIPQVYNIFNAGAAEFFRGGSFPSVYWMFSPNPVAAMPSLHAAYPTLVFLYLLKYFGKKMWWFIIYVFGVWFAIIYLGHHYVIDAVIGILYAVVTFYTVEYLFAWRAKKQTEIQNTETKNKEKVESGVEI
ncbi:MAG: phosphatase PAP2 family protein [Patescibacteria group bacterium]|nr:phosphatase PAP2 family protein [Patescibacteria group bacterium]